MAEYTMKQLSEIIDRTQSMIYNYIKEEKEFYEKHRRKDTKKGFLYDEEALERLKLKSGVLNGVGWGDSNEAKSNIPLHTLPMDAVEEEERKTDTEEELEEAKKQIEELNKRCEALETENKDLREQNGNLLWLLTQEKLEKQKLLPPPRKSIRERLKELFSNSSANKDNN